MAEEQNLTPQNTPNINPLDVVESKAADSNLVSNIVSVETGNDKNILEKAPELDQTLLEPNRLEESILLKFLKFLFVTLILVGVSIFIFFNLQLSDRLNFVADMLDLPNVSEDLASMNSEIIKLQTDVNYYRYMEINGKFNLLTFHSDTFMRNHEVANSQTALKKDREAAVEEMENVKPTISELISSIRSLYVADFTAKLESSDHKSETDIVYLYENELLTFLNKEAESIAGNTDPDSIQKYKNLNFTADLLLNYELRDTLLDPEFDFDAMNNEETYQALKKISEKTLNELSVLQNVKNHRIKWSDIINEIKAKTIEVDEVYDQDNYDELGGIVYTSYDFDTDNRTVSIVGETKDFDGQNFTTIANLIDKFNESEMFMDASMYSFSKSGSYDTGYTSTLKLSLKLIEND